MIAMERRKLTGTDLDVSPICYGTGWLGSELVGQEADKLINLVRDAGGNFLDTAHCYGFWGERGAGSSERGLADYVRRNGRSDLVIGTKGGHPGATGYRTVEHWLDPGRILADIDDSLGRLEVATIDLFWLHRDELSRPVSEIIETLNREIARGRIRWLGASNWRPSRIAEANAYAQSHGLRGFSASQPEFSLASKNTPNPTAEADTSNGTATLFLEEADQAWHRRSGLAVVPYTSTAGGYFASGGQKAQGGFDNPVSRQRLAGAQKLAKDLGATAGQVALAWLMHQDFPVFPIVGPRNADHLREDLGAAQVRLSPDQVHFLTA